MNLQRGLPVAGLFAFCSYGIEKIDLSRNGFAGFAPEITGACFACAGGAF
jgi:hypothetical protein